MRILLASFVAAAVVWAGDAKAQPALTFPAATPESVGMTKASLEALDAVVRGYIEKQEAVGAELMVIKDRKTVWHTAHGLKDIQTKAPMEIGGIFCVRSQTKPLVGTAVQMLIDEGKLSPDDHAAKFLPAFDTDSHRAITVKNLLEHRSGLPLSSLIGVDYKSLTSVQDVAGLAAKAKLQFEPGTAFNYSDDGTDTLAAIVEKVSGVPVAEFITARILTPVGMRDTACVLTKDDTRLAQVNSNHSGSTGSWVRFWAPSDGPLFPYFLGSQALYSTCEDYARFMCLWADGGKVGETRPLSDAAVERGLKPTSEMEYPTGFKGLEVRYAQLWQTWVKSDPKAGEGRGAPRATIFGHSGSDGTAAWMWPERDLIVLYFTQSRGGLSVISIESEIDRLLIRGEAPDAPKAAARNVAGLTGVYWDDEAKCSWAVDPMGDKLRLEIQGKTVMDAVAADDGGWKLELEPGTRVKFETAPDGIATAMVVSAMGKSRTIPRLAASPDLPTGAEIEARVRSAHHVDRLIVPVRREGTIKLPAVGIDGPYVDILTHDKSLTDFDARGTRTRVLVRDGKVWVRQGPKPAEELTGARAAQSLLQRPQVVFGGWTEAGEMVQVLRRVESEGRGLVVVRLVPREGNSCVLYVEDSTGRVVRQDQLVAIPGLGTVGLTTRWEDFEDVGGAVLPRLSRSEYVTPMLGKGETRFEKQMMVEGGGDPFRIDGE